MGVDWGALWALWGSIGVLWGPYGGRLGCSGASIGVDWGALGALGLLGGVLGSLLESFVGLWEPLGDAWYVCGTFLNLNALPVPWSDRLSSLRDSRRGRSEA